MVPELLAGRLFSAETCRETSRRVGVASAIRDATPAAAATLESMHARLAWMALTLAACGAAAPEDQAAPGERSSARVEMAPASGDDAEREVTPIDPGAATAEATESGEPAGGAAIRIPPDVERAIDDAVLGAITRRELPGGVVAVARRDGLAFLRAYGLRAIDPEPAPNDVDTIYDLASLTKPVATTTALALLAERGALTFDDPVARHLPAFAANGKERITIRQLLTHTGAMPPTDPLAAYEGATREQSIARILALAPIGRAGERVVYSDLGYVVLGELIAAVSGIPLDRFVDREILAPLAMRSSCFRCGASLLPRIAPTERAERRGGMLIHGDVHDPRAYRLGGVAGNAGLFTTARDLSRFARMLLGEGEVDGTRLLSAETVRALLVPERARGGVARALGWDVRGEAETRALRAARGSTMSASSYGHLGWTGTWIRIDPELDVAALLLSNDVHPDGRGDIRPLAAELEGIVAAGADRIAPRPAIDVRVGIDVELRDGLPHLRGARAVLVTHDAARARDGRRTLDVLAGSPDATLLRVLAPEHGIGGDREGAIGDARDARTRLPVLGLFGRTRRPTGAMLEGADTIVIDLVDVGARFYTYASTMHEVLVAAAARPSVRVVILDRPSPVGGTIVEGPTLDRDLVTFVSHHPIPIRHGLTLGELARLLDDELALGLGERLVIVEAEGWRRADTALDIGARWVPPSPNLPDPETVLLYPAVALLEGADVSVGRGTSEPFRVIGAPWLDSDRVLALLAATPLPGVELEATRFTPRSATHARRRCNGIRIRITDRAQYRAARTGLGLVRAMLAAHREHIALDRVLPLVGSRRALDALAALEELDAIEAIAHEDAIAFQARRARYLIYR
jgi:uncharacterized protein YbbC (DUF1343 family)